VKTIIGIDPGNKETAFVVLQGGSTWRETIRNQRTRIMNTSHLLERIEAIRNSYLEAYNFQLLSLPQSAAMEEIKATRAANRLILELESELKQSNKKKK
jgi:predicted PolB exonuclease-like 3'-5' exonuclease